MEADEFVNTDPTWFDLANIRATITAISVTVITEFDLSANQAYSRINSFEEPVSAIHVALLSDYRTHVRGFNYSATF